MRSPSIHIKETDLIKILEEAGLENVNIPKLVKFISSRSGKYSLTHRSLLVSTQKDTKKANKILSASNEDTIIMNQVILLLRKKSKHRNIQLIQPGTKDYTLLKTITQNARLFVDNYLDSDETTKSGFITYIQLAMDRMTNFTLTKISSMHETLCNVYEAQIEIRSDQHHDYTQRAYTYYNKLVLDKVGSLLAKYENQPEKYVHFVRVAKFCKENHIDPQTYIEAQFKGMEWRNGIPDPAQLLGNKSAEYLQNYLYQNPHLAKVKTQTNEQKVNRLKQIVNGNISN